MRTRTHSLTDLHVLALEVGDVVRVVGRPRLDLTRLREAARNNSAHSLSPPQVPLRGQGSARRLAEALAWKGWRLIYANAWLYRIVAWIAPRLRWLTPAWQGGWTRSRAPLKPARRAFRQLHGNRARKGR